MITQLSNSPPKGIVCFSLFSATNLSSTVKAPDFSGISRAVHDTSNGDRYCRWQDEDLAHFFHSLLVVTLRNPGCLLGWQGKGDTGKHHRGYQVAIQGYLTLLPRPHGSIDRVEFRVARAAIQTIGTVLRQEQ